MGEDGVVGFVDDEDGGRVSVHCCAHCCASSHPHYRVEGYSTYQRADWFRPRADELERQAAVFRNAAALIESLGSAARGSDRG